MPETQGVAMADQPVQKFRLGFVTAAIWKNDAGFYSVTLQRSYNDGDDWRNTDNLGAGDLLNAAKVLARSEEYIARQ
jgi:hypothetical protein